MNRPVPEKLYHAANRVLLRGLMDGEVLFPSQEFDDLSAALLEIDGGVYDHEYKEPDQ